MARVNTSGLFKLIFRMGIQRARSKKGKSHDKTDGTVRTDLRIWIYLVLLYTGAIDIAEPGR